MVSFTNTGKVGVSFGMKKTKTFEHVKFEMHVKHLSYVEWAIEYLGLKT